MTSIATGREVREATISAVVTRVDGTVERLGKIAYFHRNPIRQWLWAVGHHFWKGW